MEIKEQFLKILGTWVSRHRWQLCSYTLAKQLCFGCFHNLIPFFLCSLSSELRVLNEHGGKTETGAQRLKRTVAEYHGQRSSKRRDVKRVCSSGR